MCMEPGSVRCETDTEHEYQSSKRGAPMLGSIIRKNIDFPDHDIIDAVEVRRFTIGYFKKETLKK
jgi:hypothetical protein